MRPIAVAILLSVTLGGCPSTEASSTLEPTPMVANPSAPTPLREAAAGRFEAQPVAQPAPPPVRAVQLQPNDGSLREQLVVQAARAYRSGRRPLVQMHASWCPVCTRFDTALDAARARVALQDLVLIRVDTDVWADDLRGAGLRSPTIPAFYPLDRRGQPGTHLDGHGWRPQTDVVETLDAFVRAHWP
jgi:hypothetical protein